MQKPTQDSIVPMQAPPFLCVCFFFFFFVVVFAGEEPGYEANTRYTSSEIHPVATRVA